MIQLGQTAPEFTLPATTAETFTLSANLGSKGLCLAFYPFDWSPVCTNEIGYLNTNRDDFAAKGVALAAVSVDSPFSHDAWSKAEKLAIPLLSDFNRTVCESYGVLYEEFGGLKAFAKRSVFVIDAQMTVRYAWVTEDPTVEPDYSAIMAACDAL